MSELPSEYHRRLPYGERLSVAPLLGHPFFPFEGEVQAVPLDQPVLPEPPRNGEDGGKPCPKCADPDRSVIWQDEQWQLKTFGPTGLPLVTLLESREHYRLDNLPPAAEHLANARRVAAALAENGGEALELGRP
ncbi:hypothetical protein [Kribbella sp. NPDC048928]|uniref:hypothetical protein n=1 Tax=Kribbella sp. NPDC048928 TaxID=3364111 RepID=UPI003722CDD4